MEEFTPTAEVHIPWAQDVIRRPETYIAEKIEEKRIEVQAEIEKLEAKLEALRTGLVSLNTYEPTYLEKLDPETREQIINQRQEREQESKEIVCETLAAVGLDEQDAVVADYSEFVDHDLAGGYTEEHRVLLAHQAGVYLVGHQVTFSNSVGARRDYLNAHGTKYIIHKDAANPLKVEGKGVFPNLGEISLEATIPTEWSLAKEEVGSWVEAIRAKRFADRLIPFLPTDDLQPIVYENGHVDNSRLYAQDIMELSPGIHIKITGVYDQVRRHDKTKIELDYVSISLVHGENVVESYVVDIATLEIRPHPFDSYDGFGNKHLHDKAEALLKLRNDSIGSKPPKD